MSIKTGTLMVVAMMSLVVAACAGTPTEVQAPEELITSAEQLLDVLDAAELPAVEAGTVQQPFFEPTAQVLDVGGDQIQVFEFEETADAEQAAAEISPAGSTIGTHQVTWMATPHFYRTGNLIVLYVGEQEAVVQALQAVLGPQIAGG